MKLCRFQHAQGPPRIGVAFDDTSVLDLTTAGVDQIEKLLEVDNLATHMNRLVGQRYRVLATLDFSVLR